VRPHGAAGSEHLGLDPQAVGEGVNNLSAPVDNCVDNFCGEHFNVRQQAQRSSRLKVPGQLKTRHLLALNSQPPLKGIMTLSMWAHSAERHGVTLLAVAVRI
jgi:hypothetical protein